MLRLITGRAGAGQTALVMDEIRRAALSGEGGRVLLVPEQYSHEAERELARVAGPGLPLFAEVLSFTGLARKLEGSSDGATRGQALVFSRKVGQGDAKQPSGIV